MMEGTFKKVFQKRVYDLVSHKNGIFLILGGAFLLIISALHFGEAWLEWSHEKYEAVFNSFSDNIMGKSFRERLSLPVPIDVVYTWVNGSDPELIRQLDLVRLVMEQKNNLSREEQCTYTNCLTMGVLVKPPLHANTRLQDIKEADSIFRNVTALEDVRESPQLEANFTLLVLDRESDVQEIVKQKTHGWQLQGVNYTVKPAFYTSDTSLPRGLLLPEMVMMSGYPGAYSEGDIQQALAARLNVSEKNSVGVKLFTDKGMALLQVADKKHYNGLTKSQNFTIDGKELRLSPVKLVWDLKFVIHEDIAAASRFEDNEELRYSLRSVEKFAPWVRHIYIVTNGQIPYWLNLDNPHVSVITHDEIFSNASYLPTFSSPAIEANIHKIPGLSDKFLYLNDDVMFGKPVWPDDFYSYSAGHKVYLTWPVPNCNEGCPSTWIMDGYCDKACNSSDCDWDGGDCKVKGGQLQLGAGFHNEHGYALNEYASYCATGCSNNWLADKYCDQACNVYDCGFDAGDCGVASYKNLYRIDLRPSNPHFNLPPGERIAYMNLTQMVGDGGRVTSAQYTPNSALRSAAVSNKFQVLTIILNKDQNATTLEFYLDIHKGDNVTLKLNVTVAVDTSVEKNVTKEHGSTNHNASKTMDKAQEEDMWDAEAFQEVMKHAKHPVVKIVPSISGSQLSKLDVHPDLVDFYHGVNMSQDLRGHLDSLRGAKDNGELTDLGVKARLYDLLQHFKDEMKSLKGQIEAEKAKMLQLEKKNIENGLSDRQDGAADLLVSKTKNHVVPQRETVNKPELLQQPLLLQSQKHQLPLKQLHLQNHRPDPQQDMLLQNNQDNVQQLPHGHKRLVSPPDQEKVELSREGRSLDQSEIELKKSLFSQQGQLPQVNKDKNVANNISLPLDPKRFHNSNMRNRTKDKLGVVDDDLIAAQKGPGRKLLAAFYWSQQLQQYEDNRARVRTQIREGEELSDEEFLKLVSVGTAGRDADSDPWEKVVELRNHPQNSSDRERRDNAYIVEGWQGRQLLDTFGDSLRHVNRIYNNAFGFTARKVPGHMPHMIDKNIMGELQARFPKEWDTTSSHKMRSSTDMQYAFAYYYYLMGVTVNQTVESIFDQMDTDHTSVLSDREIRTLAAKMYDLPLYLETLTGLENMITNCSQHIVDPTLTLLTEEQQEIYYDKNMPQVTRYLFIHCDHLVHLVKEKFKPKPKYRTAVMDDSDIAFKMIHTNVSHVVGQLDDIRKNPKKFICLNDNIDHSGDESKTVKAILQDFYESLLPVPSQFELPRDYRNRFLHMDQLRDWRAYRDKLRLWTHIALGLLVSLTVISFLGDKIDSMRRKWLTRTRRGRKSSSNSESCSSSSSCGSLSPSSGRDSSLWLKTELVETV